MKVKKKYNYLNKCKNTCIIENNILTLQTEKQNNQNQRQRQEEIRINPNHTNGEMPN